MKTFGQGFAHGKVILIGEHAVVYGHPGIAIPFKPVFVRVRVLPSQEDAFSFQGSVEKRMNVKPEFQFIFSLLDYLRGLLVFGPVRMDIDNQIPASAGMGSSAAISGAIVQAIYDWLEIALTQELRFTHTQFAETIVHGSASGIDALTTNSDQIWYFVKGKPPVALSIRMPGYLLVANTGIKGSTKMAVSHIANLMKQNLAQAHLESLGLMGLLMKEALEKKEIDDVARLMNQAHFHLQELGVSHPRLDEWIQVTMTLGALGAKLTGGGLGGSLIALFDDSEKAQETFRYFKEKLTTDVWLLDLSQ